MGAVTRVRYIGLIHVCTLEPRVCFVKLSTVSRVSNSCVNLYRAQPNHGQ